VYAAAMKEIAGNWKNQAHDGFALSVRANEHPVVSVSWDDAQAFCKWLSKQEGKTYRLPTDREWSTAAGLAANEKTGQTDFPWGGVWPPPNGAGNYSDRSRKAKAPRDGALYIDDYDDAFPTTAPVMSFKPNKLGLFDLGGNALEWCDDWFNKDHIERILRGGSWHNADPVDLFSINRRRLTPGSRHNNLGFRVVMVTSAP
jgi:formylglycine-generating enzyme required for sulfatase activity